MWIPKEAVLITGNMALLGLAQLYFYCTFFDTTLLFIPYPAKIYAFKRLEQKFPHSSSYIKSIGRYLVWSSMSYLIQNFCNPPLQIFLQNTELSNTFASFNNMTTLFHLCSLISAVAVCIVQFDWHLEWCGFQPFWYFWDTTINFFFSFTIIFL